MAMAELQRQRQLARARIRARVEGGSEEELTTERKKGLVCLGSDEAVRIDGEQ